MGPKTAGAPYWADAAFIAAAGIPTVIFGPSGEGAHATRSGSACPPPRRWPRPCRAGAELCVSVRQPGLRPGGRAGAGATRATSTARCRLRAHAACTRCGDGVGVKDESDRLGLPAFKVLGASWAVERALRAHPGVHTLVAASAGNHGRAVAHVAALRGLAAASSCPRARVPRAARRSPARAPRS